MCIAQDRSPYLKEVSFHIDIMITMETELGPLSQQYSTGTLASRRYHGAALKLSLQPV